MYHPPERLRSRATDVIEGGARRAGPAGEVEADEGQEHVGAGEEPAGDGDLPDEGGGEGGGAVRDLVAQAVENGRAAMRTPTMAMPQRMACGNMRARAGRAAASRRR
jgi:hypothetical protein